MTTETTTEKQVPISSSNGKITKNQRKIIHTFKAFCAYLDEDWEQLIQTAPQDYDHRFRTLIEMKQSERTEEEVLLNEPILKLRLGKETYEIRRPVWGKDMAFRKAIMDLIQGAIKEVRGYKFESDPKDNMALGLEILPILADKLPDQLIEILFAYAKDQHSFSEIAKREGLSTIELVGAALEVVQNELPLFLKMGRPIMKMANQMGFFQQASS